MSTKEDQEFLRLCAQHMALQVFRDHRHEPHCDAADLSFAERIAELDDASRSALANVIESPDEEIRLLDMQAASMLIGLGMDSRRKLAAVIRETGDPNQLYTLITALLAAYSQAPDPVVTGPIDDASVRGAAGGGRERALNTETAEELIDESIGAKERTDARAPAWASVDCDCSSNPCECVRIDARKETNMSNNNSNEDPEDRARRERDRRSATSHLRPVGVSRMASPGDTERADAGDDIRAGEDAEDAARRRRNERSANLWKKPIGQSSGGNAA